MSKRKIQELYREEMKQKDNGKNNSKGILWIAIAIVVVFIWIIFFDGQIGRDNIISWRKIE